MENRKDTKFSYDYSAEKSKEAEEILGKYVAQEKTPLEKMKEIDAQVTKKVTALALAIGIFGTLVFGGGMSIVLQADKVFQCGGIVIGIIGIGICGYTLLFYQKKLKKERAKVADEMVKLRKEI